MFCVCEYTDTPLLQTAITKRGMRSSVATLPGWREGRDEETHGTWWWRLLGISSATSSPACIYRELVRTSYGRIYGWKYSPRGRNTSLEGEGSKRWVTMIATHRRCPLRSVPSSCHSASRSCQAAHHSAKCLPGVARVLERAPDMREKMLECCGSVGSLRR